MASYVTLQEIKDMGLMPGNEVDRFEIDYPGVALVFGNACSAYANSYCQKRHETPFNPAKVPDAIKYHVVQMVVYKMYMRRGINPASEQDMLIKASFDESIQWLKDVAKGLVEIPRDADLTPDLDEMGPLFDTSTNPYQVIDQQSLGDGDCGCGC